MYIGYYKQLMPSALEGAVLAFFSYRLYEISVFAAYRSLESGRFESTTTPKEPDASHSR